MTPKGGAGQARACPWGSLHLQALLFRILPPIPAWSPASKALASTSIAAFVGIFLVVGALSLRKYLSMQPPA